MYKIAPKQINMSETQGNCKVCCKLYGIWNNVPLYVEEIENILHEEILFFEKKVLDHEAKRKPQFDDLVKIIEKSVKVTLPKSKVNLYGSYATGLSMPWSDIDMVIDIGNDAISPTDLLPQIQHV